MEQLLQGALSVSAMAEGRDTYDRRNRGLWIALAAPGAIWLIVLFVVPFYVMLCVAGGSVNEFFQTRDPGLESAALVERQPDRGLARPVRVRGVSRPARAADRALHRDRNRALAGDRLPGGLLSSRATRAAARRCSSSC